MGLYSITTRADGLVLTADIWNADHQNHVTHTEPASINSYEEDVTQMNIEAAPATVDGVPLRPTQLSTELARYRYVVKALKSGISGGRTVDHWYTDLASVTGAVTLAAVAARRQQTTPQSFPSGLVQEVQWDTTVYASPVMAQVTGLRAPVAGKYLCGVMLGFGSDDGDFGPLNDFILSLRVQGVQFATRNTYSGADTTSPKVLCVQGIATFNIFDELNAYVYQNNGSAKTPYIAIRPAIWMCLVGR